MFSVLSVVVLIFSTFSLEVLNRELSFFSELPFDLLWLVSLIQRVLEYFCTPHASIVRPVLSPVVVIVKGDSKKMVDSD